MNTIERVTNGEIVVLPKYLQKLELLEPLKTIVFESIEEECGKSTRILFEEQGIEYLHTLPSNHLLGVYQKAEKRIFSDLPDVTATIAESLGASRPFYVHFDSYIRIMVPIQHLDESFNYRPGRLLPHKGVHQDYALKHKFRDAAINFWMALGLVKDGNGMVLYPDMWGIGLPEGHKHKVPGSIDLGQPLTHNLNPGDVIVFHCQHVHGSVQNTTDQTRIALTGRICFRNFDVLEKWEWIRYE